MFVVHLTASRFFGGPERQMLELAKALGGKGDSPHLPERPEGCCAQMGTVPFSARNYRSLFVSFSEQGLCRAFIEKARQDGFEAIALQYDTPRLLAALRELVCVLRRAGADVLCCHGYKAGLLGLLAARRLGIPTIAVSRGWTRMNRRVRLYEALDRRVLRWMDKVVCVSEGQAAKGRRAGVRADKIAVIRNAIRPERFDNPDPEYRKQLLRMFGAEKWSVVSSQWSEPELIVGAAGRLSPEKGFSVLVDAAEKVLGSGGRGPGVRD